MIISLWRNVMKTETTKQRILAEAVSLFAKEGYEAVSVEQIAKAVGIKAPSQCSLIRKRKYGVIPSGIGWRKS